MTGATARPFGEPLQVLFGAGTCAGQSDGQLLARFVAGRDQAGELAFELLVKRHGPMVERVCQQVLDDPNDVHDSVQAVFLVLARRADAIRNRDSVGSWLYGVTLRVAARARVAAIRRNVRDRRTTRAAQAQANLALGARPVETSRVEREERAGIVYHELSRLPEKYRAPIVLCYMEGMTHDEAAACLSWPVGTVRSRLSRARDTLRRRLSRRGLAAPAVVGPIGAWLAGDQVALAGPASTIPGDLVAHVVKLVSQAAAGPISGATPAHATTMALAEGVLNMMTIKKLTVMAAVVLSLATLTVGGGVALVRTSRAQPAQTKPYKVEERIAPPGKNAITSIKPDDVDPQLKQMVDLAKRRFEMMLRQFQEGEIGLDRVIDACDRLGRVELRAANSSAARRAAKEGSLKRLQGFERLGESLSKAGNASTADVEGIRLLRLQAEIDLKTPDDERADSPAILQRLKELERKVEQLEKRVPSSLGGRM